MPKIYVVASFTLKSGGSESLHQLVSRLNSLGYESYIYYKNPHRNTVVKRFLKYNVTAADVIEDDKENLIIVPEVFTGFLEKFTNIKKSIWWLSLDFHFLSTPDKRALKFLNKKKFPKFFQKPLELLMLITKMSSLDDYKLVDLSKDGKNYYHLYNCEYIRGYLLNHGIKGTQMSYLCGPIADEHFVGNDTLIKNPKMILYNPSKGLEFTQKIIDYANKTGYGFIFVPLKNMTQEEIVNYEKSAMLYIDFGFFPGPERIPRESVLHNCMILTGRKGSAGNDEDIKIPIKYKFEDIDENISSIVEQMKYMLENSDELQGDFQAYRNKIKYQRKNFDNDIIKVGKFAKEGDI